VIEYVFERKIMKRVVVYGMRFGLEPGKGTTTTMFL